MKRGHYVLAGMATAGAAAFAATAYLRRQQGRRSGNDGGVTVPRAAVEVFDGSDTGTVAPVAAGRPETHDPLGGKRHYLSATEAQEARYRAKLGPGGKATSREREQMYHEPTDGRSGSMSDLNGREDQAPIGRIKQ
jgi:hypothetical protein